MKNAPHLMCAVWSGTGILRTFPSMTVPSSRAWLTSLTLKGRC
jgi:hypothetical protein